MRSLSLLLTLALVMPADLLAQGRGADPAAEFTRANKKFLAAFKSVTSKPATSTVRILCNGKETALGVIVGPDGWILTKANDLAGAITVRVNDGTTHDADLIGIHEPHDLALLKIDVRGLAPIEFSESKVVDVGSWIACVGPGDEPVAVGVISVATRNISTKGRPLDPNKSPYLGVSLEPAENGGVKVQQVMPGTPASKIGLKVNDVIIALSGQSIEGPDAFMKILGKNKPGDVVKLTIRRGEETIEKAATLDRRPLGSARGEMQNKMGSELSSRRSGYATILQHDSVVRPIDCGGPIVDLDGRVLGLNICRAGRVESWAVPSEAIQPLLFELMSGRLSPEKVGFAPPKLSPDEKLAQAKARLVRAERDKSRFEKDIDEARKALQSAESEVQAQRLRDSTEAIDRLAGLMHKRLTLMNDVAGWKWNHRQEILDPVRENDLLTKLKARAKELGIDPKAVDRFFQAQLAASRMLQEERIATLQKDNALASVKGDLSKDFRPRIDVLNGELVDVLGVVLRFMPDSSLKIAARSREAIERTLSASGISPAIRAKALEGLQAP